MHRSSRTTALACLLAACGAGAGARSASPADEVRVGDVHRLDVGVTRGELIASDRVEDLYHHVDDYDVLLQAGQLTRLHVPHDAFDPWLRVTGPGGFHAEDDDITPATLDAMLQFVAPETGTYRVSVAAAVRNELGSYAIELELLSRLAGEALSLGTSLTALREPENSLFHFDGEGGATVHLTTDAALTLTVLGPRGDRWMSEAGSLMFALPTSGGYQLIVSGPASPSSFEIASSARPPVVLHAGEAVPVAPFAGPDARGRVRGLIVGLSEYTELPALYGAADDAQFLAQAIEATHLAQGADLIVLRDAQASRAAFFAALGTLASRTQPGDVVLVFFAGHGDRQPSPSELDGLDETIVMIDGPVTDTEVATALDAVHAAILVLAIDACHSGGFADDFMNRPGRVGLFSSDADVISDTAEARRAGGYLSWFLRRGVLGEADDGARDGVLSIGELTDFIHAGFAHDDAIINPAGHASRGQYAVIDRGAITWDTTLWVYPRSEDLALPQVPSLALQSPAP